MLSPKQNAETILVVDDDSLGRRLYHFLLKDAGYQVETVANGHDAIEFLLHREVDLVLLDVQLSGDLDGVETYRRILALLPDQKTAVLTGNAETDQMTDLLRLGIKTWARKPLTPKRLGEMVRAALNRLPDCGAVRG